MSICVGNNLLGYQATDPFPGRIDNSINEWRRRLECVVKNNGGHIEQCVY